MKADKSVWRVSIKRKLGNVWHLSCYGDVKPAAHCSSRIALDPTEATTEPGTEKSPGAICGRCRNIKWQIGRRAER